MCTYSITLNDSLVDQVRPEFPNDEEMYAIVKQRLQSLEDGTAKLVDGDEVFAQIQSRYGFKA